jgi:predicted permease
LNSLVLILPAALIRLAIGPLIAYMLIHVLHVQEPLSKAIMLESGMPSMVLTLVIAQEYTLDTNILAQLIALSTLLSIISLSLI